METCKSLNRRAPSDDAILVETAHACLRKDTSMRRASSNPVGKAPPLAALGAEPAGMLSAALSPAGDGLRPPVGGGLPGRIGSTSRAGAPVARPF